MIVDPINSRRDGAVDRRTTDAFGTPVIDRRPRINASGERRRAMNGVDLVSTRAVNGVER